jgi:hypothetical protein
VLSDGQSPNVMSYPRGTLAVIPDELLLVRRIRFHTTGPGLEQPTQADQNHPLGLYSYPDDINLLGYIVRALPRIAN